MRTLDAYVSDTQEEMLGITSPQTLQDNGAEWYDTGWQPESRRMCHHLCIQLLRLGMKVLFFGTSKL